MDKITLLTPGSADAAQAEFLRKAPPLNLFAALAHSPAIATAVATLGGKLLYDSALDPRVREIAILRVGHVLHCDYEVAHHERIGREVGLDDRTLVAVRDDDVRDMDEDAVVAMLWATAVATHGSAPPEVVERAVRIFNEASTVELAVTVGYYVMLASLLISLDVPIERADDATGFEVAKRPEHLD